MRSRSDLSFRPAGCVSGRLRHWTLAVVGLAFLALSSAAGAATVSSVKDDPTSFVTTVGNRVLEVLDAQGMERDERLRHFRDIFVHALDLDTCAKRVLARHWRTATKSQRERYVTLFRQYVVNMYAVQLGSYAGAKFTVLRHQDVGEDESLVMARFQHEEGPPLAMNVRVRQANGRFKITDVNIAGISLVVTKRSEFDAVISREGLTGLLRRLEEKQATMLRRQQDFVPLIAEAMRAMQGGTNVFFSN